MNEHEDYETIKYEEQQDYSPGDEVYHDWKMEHLDALEQEFVEKFPPEEVPLDDEMPDWLDNLADEFEEYCKEEFNKREW